jgi:hypothetical protein
MLLTHATRYASQLGCARLCSLAGFANTLAHGSSTVLISHGYSDWYALHGVGISNAECCTLSKTRGLTDFLMWLHKGSEEKGWAIGNSIQLRDPFW